MKRMSFITNEKLLQEMCVHLLRGNVLSAFHIQYVPCMIYFIMKKSCIFKPYTLSFNGFFVKKLSVGYL